MDFVYMIIFFILGLFMGSFYTVVGSRMPRGESFIRGRSYCDHCHHTLSFFDMVPIVSYLFLRGKCRYCGAKFSSLSSWMEFFTGVLFALSYYTFHFHEGFFISLGIVSMLSILSVSDISYYIIPDEVLIFFSGYFLILHTLYHGVISSLFSVLSGLLLFGIMYFIMILGNFIFKKETLGGGDIKLMFVVGLVLHPLVGILLIFLSSFIALPVSLLLLLKRGENLVPFGPFLLISFLFLYMISVDASTLLNFIQSI